MISNVPVCRCCGVETLAGSTEHASQFDCVHALKDAHIKYRRHLQILVMDQLEEVTNQSGGVIGYKLTLNANETEELCKAIERTL